MAEKTIPRYHNDSMSSQILLISNDPQDHELAEQIGKANKLDCTLATERKDARWVLTSQTPTLVFWDAENEAAYQAVGDILPKYVKAPRIFAITSKPLEYYPHLYRFPHFGHHLLRRYSPTATELINRLAVAALKTDQFNLERYFPEGTPTKKIKIARFSHTRAAIEALNNHLAKQGVRGRLAGLVASCTDELILNSIFKAPGKKAPKVPENKSGEPSDFELEGQVEVELADAENYMGVCVTDPYGTLKKSKFYDSIRKHYAVMGPRHISEQTSIGLHGVISTGLSLVLVTKPKARTQAMLFFPKVESFKDFKLGFRFLTMTEHLLGSEAP